MSGHIVEVYEYQKPVLYGYSQNQPLISSKPDEDDKQRHKKFATRRARHNVRRLASANFDDKSKFITLTFRHRITDIAEANICFQNFIKRMRRKYGGFRYIAVIEFHKNGGIHYHMLSNLPYIPNETLGKVWSHGFVRINQIDQVDNIGAYISKYMTIENDDERLNGKKSYFTSQNLIRPLVLRGDKARQWAELAKRQKKDVYRSEYESDHVGSIRYTQYNLNRQK